MLYAIVLCINTCIYTVICMCVLVFSFCSRVSFGNMLCSLFQSMCVYACVCFSACVCWSLCVCWCVCVCICVYGWCMRRSGWCVCVCVWDAWCAFVFLCMCVCVHV